MFLCPGRASVSPGAEERHDLGRRAILELEGTLPAVEALGYAVDEALRDLKMPPMTQTYTADGPTIHDEGRLDHLLISGARDPGFEYDDDDEDDWNTV